MNLKKIKIMSSIGIFVLSFIFHFVYDLIPCTLTSIFFQVNESIWEHMKLIFTSIIMYGIIDYILLNKFNIKYNNFFNSLFITAISIIPIFLIIYLPIFYRFGESLPINIIVMSIAIIISQIISYYILKANDCPIGNKISIVLIVISYIVFGYLTYNPIKSQIFLDSKHEKYGINNYNI